MTQPSEESGWDRPGVKVPGHLEPERSIPTEPEPETTTLGEGQESPEEPAAPPATVSWPTAPPPFQGNPGAQASYAKMTQGARPR